MHQSVSNIHTEALSSPDNQWGECVTDADCIITGCSGQVCASEPVITTCEWREEYACYHDPNITTCGCNQGTCGWAQTPELEACRSGYPSGDSYVPGDVIVGFNDNVTIEEAGDLINSYNLTWEPGSYWDLLKWGVVKVVSGEELQWIATFENESIVKYAQLNWIVVTDSP